MTEAANYKGHITDEIWVALKKIRKDKTLNINGLPYVVYLKLLPIFVPLLEILLDHWMEQGSIRQRFNRDVVKLLSKNKHGVDKIHNFSPS